MCFVEYYITVYFQSVSIPQSENCEAVHRVIIQYALEFLFTMPKFKIFGTEGQFQSHC